MIKDKDIVEAISKAGVIESYMDELRIHGDDVLKHIVDEVAAIPTDELELILFENMLDDLPRARRKLFAERHAELKQAAALARAIRDRNPV